MFGGVFRRQQALLGTVLANRYEIFENIGRGHLGVVYKARATDGRVVAVKVLSKGNDRALQRFKREARAAGLQNHPNIVQVYDMGNTADGDAFIVMEFIDGYSFRILIRNEAPLPINRCGPIFVQICDALSHLHKNGVVHRDLKPANIMLIENPGGPEWVKLVDFGLAKHIDPQQAALEKVTLEGYVMGTPAYMSPEQCMAMNVDERSDIYSLGCCMFRALTGLAPITGSNAQETMTKQIVQEPTPFSRIPSSIYVPEGMQNIINKTLAKRPSDRYQSAEELKHVLLTTNYN